MYIKQGRDVIISNDVYIKHPDFTTYSYNQGSILIDPWRYIPSIDNCEVIHIGDSLS